MLKDKRPHYTIFYSDRIYLPSKCFGASIQSENSIVAVPTGEYRNPKEGEWYLSGAIVEAYYAKTDLDWPHYIAQIKRVIVETTFKYYDI